MQFSKLVVAMALGFGATVAVANDVKDGFYVGGSVGAFGMTGAAGDEEGSSTAYGLNAGYQKYIDTRTSLLFDLSYIKTNSSVNDKFLVPSVLVGYDFTLSNGKRLTPKVGVGMYKSYFDTNAGEKDGNTGVALKVGIDYEFKKNTYVGLMHTHIDAAETNGRITTLTLTKKF